MPDLLGNGVLVTRPADQAQDLVAEIEAANGNAVVFPALEIRGRDAAEINDNVRELNEPDICLFVSPNAVRYGIAYAGNGLTGAIGPGTAAAIRRHDHRVDIVPDGGYDSEHLLACKELRNIEGRTVRIVRGESGRELLGSTLAHRGAQVDYLSVYSRRCPTASEWQVRELLERWEQGDIAAWTIMSIETLNNFLALVGDEGERLAAGSPLVSPAARVIKEASERIPGLFATQAPGTSAFEITATLESVLPAE